RSERLGEPAGVGDQLADARQYDALELGSGDAQPLGRCLAGFADQWLRDVIPVPHALLDGMARGHAMALAVITPPRQQARVCGLPARPALDGVDGEFCLDLIPQLLTDDRLVLARVMLIPVHDLAAIGPVLQHQIERAARQRLAAPTAARAADPGFAANVLSI